jgi:hypothetical protein
LDCLLLKEYGVELAVAIVTEKATEKEAEVLRWVLSSFI